MPRGDARNQRQQHHDNAVKEVGPEGVPSRQGNACHQEQEADYLDPGIEPAQGAVNIAVLVDKGMVHRALIFLSRAAIPQPMQNIARAPAIPETTPEVLFPIPGIR